MKQSRDCEKQKDQHKERKRERTGYELVERECLRERERKRDREREREGVRKPINFKSNCYRKSDRYWEMRYTEMKTIR